MNGLARLSFSVQPFGETRSITPCVNGQSLVEIVTAFELERGFVPAGGYGGLIPEFFDYGPLAMYFSGDFGPNSYFANLQGVYLLACECGEVGCWPFMAHVETSAQIVTWSSFRQPHRNGRDYSAFGPFVFEVNPYLEAVAALENQLRTPARL